MRFGALVTLAVILAAIFACCTTTNVLEEAKKKYNEIQDMSGEAVIKSGDVEKIVYFAFKKPRSFMLAGKDEVLTVSNGSVEWVYYGKNNSYVIKSPERPPFDYGDILKNGTARKEGEYYIIESDSGSVWLDESFLPVKIERSGVVIEFRQLNVNTGINDKDFTFVPPMDAEKKEPRPEKLLSLDEAQKEVNFSIVVPTYTAGHDFIGALVFKFDDSEIVNLYYRLGTSTLIIVESTSPAVMPLSGEENVTIGNTTGQIAEFGDSTMLRFKIEDIEVTISGKLDRSEIMRIASSMLN
ncbi:LolA family protein [Archaeoglobus veneficus]|uniref:DUF4367 domain-containing protein n=1 Tax=Archaeoglobus veneficus (strain DSM 11195 / SNP6) TaxID=693661 RepID=F2KSQ4_ARCVS|nr:DUF4367 domain-containing protein [Archaeoglobus veneficus]AEA46949.1 hypothetical protein Arcve_0938 [Archaeoglobus veneficus SNP6]